MAAGFNLTAQINLRGPSNISTIVADIKKQLGSITANVNLTVDPSTINRVTQLNSALRDLNRNLGQTATSASSAAAALRAVGTAIGSVRAQNLAQNLNSVSSAAAKTNQSMNAVSKSVSVTSSELVEFGKQSGLAIRRFAAFSTVTGAVYGVVNAISQGINSYIEFDRQLVKLQQVTGQSAKGLQGLENTITNLSTSLGVGSMELTEVSSTLAQAGLSAKDTERALKALALSSLAPSFDTMNETVEGSIALMRQFGIGAGDLEKALGSVNSVAARFAVEASDLITAIQRTGGVFATASRGVSEGTDALNEFLAVFTSVRATTRESAETIATGLRTIFTRIQREDTINALKEYGVNLTDLDGKFVGAYKAVELLSSGLSSLDPRDLKFSRIVEELGGFRQIGKVIPLIQQFSTAQDALKVAQTGQGSLALDAAKAQESLAVQISKVRQEFLALFREIGQSDSFQTIIRGALSVSSALIKIADSVKGILPVLGVMLAFKGASALTQFGSGFLQGARGRPTTRSGGGPLYAFSEGGGGNTINAMVSKGEAYIPPGLAREIGYDKLNRMNRADTNGMGKYSNGSVGGISKIGIFDGPGTETSDSIGPLQLPVGAYILRARATESLGLNKKYALGGRVTIGVLKRASKGGRDIANYQKAHSDIVRDEDEVYANEKRITVGLTGEDKSRLFMSTLNPEWSPSSGVPRFKRPQKRLKSSKSNKRTDGITYFEKEIWPETFEDIVTEKISRITGQAWQKTSMDRRFGSKYPMDIFSNSGDFAEVKFTTEPVSYNHILNKKLRHLFMSKAKQYWGFTKNIDKDNRAVNLGNAVVFQTDPRDKENFRTEFTAGKLDPLKRKNSGGPIQNFPIGGEIKLEKTPTASFAEFSRSEILGSLTLPVIAEKLGIRQTEVYRRLGERNLTPLQVEKRKALEALVRTTRAAALADEQKKQGILTSKGLEFGAAGMYGVPFAKIIKTLTSPKFTKHKSVDVVIRSGVLKKADADKLSKRHSSIMRKTAKKDAEILMTSQIMSQLGKRKYIDLDFDEVLATNTAPTPSKDPKAPKFAEFYDDEKVKEVFGLGGKRQSKARLTVLGRELVRYIAENPEQINKFRVITARPQKTVPYIQAWLNKQKLFIPVVKGVGSLGMSDKQIAKAKASELRPGTLFVDDTLKNYRRASEKSGVTPFLYKTKPIKTDYGLEANAEGTAFEYVLRTLGAPQRATGANKSMDFPTGLGVAAKYFIGGDGPLKPNIPTDAKRTLDGPSTVESNVINYLAAKGYAAGGAIQKFGKGTEKPVSKRSQTPSFISQKNIDSTWTKIKIALGLPQNAPLPRISFNSEMPSQTYGNSSGITDVLAGQNKKTRQAFISQLDPGWYSKDPSASGVNINPNDKNRMTVLAHELTHYGLQLMDPKDRKRIRTNILKNKSSIGSYLDELAQKGNDDSYGSNIFAQNVTKLPVVYGRHFAGEYEDAIRLVLGEKGVKLLYASAKTISQEEGITEIVSRAIAGDKKAQALLTKILPKEQVQVLLSQINPKSKPIRKNIGGIIPQRFSVGGMPRQQEITGLVPGVGDGDTVSTNLGVGAFVIKKPSVNKIGAKNLAALARYAAGGHAKKSIPALVTPGEWIYTKSEAERIGYGNLDRMNRLGRFASGGGVGIQTFASGGSSMPLRPETIGRATVMIDDKAKTALKQLEAIINQLGITGSKTSLLLAGLNTSAAVSFKTAEKAAKADLAKIKASGGSIEQISTAESSLSQIQDARNEDVNKRRILQGAFSGVSGLSSGEVQQQILLKADEESIRRTEAAQAQKINAQKKEQKKQEKDALLVKRQQAEEQARESMLTQAKNRTGGPLSTTQIANIETLAKKQAASVQLSSKEKAEIAARTVDQSALTHTERANIKNASTLNATSAITGIDKATLKSQNINGDDIRSYARESMMDRKTLADMDKQYRVIRTAELQAAGKTAGEAKRMVEQELKDRRATAQAAATAKGLVGPGSAGLRYTGIGTVGDAFGGIGSRVARGVSVTAGRIYNRGVFGNIADMGRGIGSTGMRVAGPNSFMASMALGMLAGQGENIASVMGGSKRTKAGRGAALESGISTVASGLALTGQVAMMSGPMAPLVAGIGLTVTALAALSGGASASAKALKEFDNNLKIKAFEDANELLARSMEDLSKDISNVNLQKTFEDRLKEALSTSGGAGGIIANEKKDEIKQKQIASMSMYQYVGSFMPAFLGGGAGDENLRTRQISSKDFSQSDYRDVARQQLPQLEKLKQAAIFQAESAIKNGVSAGDIATQDSFKNLREILAKTDLNVLPRLIELDMKEGEARARAASAVTVAERAKANATVESITAEKNNIIVENARNSVILKNMEKTNELNKAMAEADRAAREVAKTFGSIARIIEQAIGRTAFELEALSDATDGQIDALSGQAKMGRFRSRDANVIENPSAYSDKEREEAGQRVARGIFNPDQVGLAADEKAVREKRTSEVARILQMDTEGMANRIAGAAKSIPKGGTFEQVSAAMSTQLEAEIKDLPDQVKEDYRKSFKVIIDKIKEGGGSDQEKSNTLIKQVNDDMAKGASEAYTKVKNLATQYTNTITAGLNKFADATNKATEAQLKAVELINKANDTRASGDISLRETLSGGSIGLNERKAFINSQVSRLTGGTTDPDQIRQNIVNKTAELTQKQEDLKDKLDKAKSPEEQKQISEQAAPAIANLTTEINQSQKALETLATSTELASAAMNELQSVQKLQAERLQNIDQILSSSPKELRKFNESLVRVQQRAMGINPNPSREAYRAYNQALRQSGGNRRAATMAAQEQMAQDRAMDLRTMEQYSGTYKLNLINNGMSQEQANLMYNRGAANVRGQMAYESGAAQMYGPGLLQGIMAGVDPLRDPAGAAAAQAVREATDQQAKAMEAQAKLEQVKGLNSLNEATTILQKTFIDLSNIINQMMNKMDKDAGAAVPDAGAAAAAAAAGVGGGLGIVTTKNGVPVQNIAGPNAVGIAQNVKPEIYASFGQLIDFQPKGTDTVPAMLTPGEFVVNARATAQHLPLLQAINSGATNIVSNPMSKGGVVYLAQGGQARRREDIEAEMSSDTTELQSMDQQLDNQRQTYASSDAAVADQQEVQRLAAEREAAQREGWWYEARGDSNQAAANWARNKVGDGNWMKMTEDQRNAERDKYLPQFNQIQSDYDQKRKDAGVDTGSIRSANFFYDQRDQNKERFEAARLAEEKKVSEIAARTSETPEQQARRSELESRQAQNRTNVRDLDFLEGRERKGPMGIGNEDYGVKQRAAELAGISKQEYDGLMMYPGVFSGAKPPPEVQAKLDKIKSNEAAATEQLKQEASARLSQQNIAAAKPQQRSGAAAQQAQQANDAKQKAETQKQEQQTSAATTQANKPVIDNTTAFTEANKALAAQAAVVQGMVTGRTMAIQNGQFDPGEGTKQEKSYASRMGMTVQELKYAQQMEKLSRIKNPASARVAVERLKERNEWVEPSALQAEQEKLRDMSMATVQASRQKAFEDKLAAAGPGGLAEYQARGGKMPTETSAALAFQIADMGSKSASSLVEAKVAKVTGAKKEQEGPLLPSTMNGEDARYYQVLEEKRRKGRFSTNDPLTPEERETWKRLRRQQELGYVPNNENNTQRLALIGLSAPRNDDQEEEYLRLRYQADTNTYVASEGKRKTITGATPNETFENFKARLAAQKEEAAQRAENKKNMIVEDFMSRRRSNPSYTMTDYVAEKKLTGEAKDAFETRALNAMSQSFQTRVKESVDTPEWLAEKTQIAKTQADTEASTRASQERIRGVNEISASLERQINTERENANAEREAAKVREKAEFLAKRAKEEKEAVALAGGTSPADYIPEGSDKTLREQIRESWKQAAERKDGWTQEQKDKYVEEHSASEEAKRIRQASRTLADMESGRRAVDTQERLKEPGQRLSSSEIQEVRKDAIAKAQSDEAILRARENLEQQKQKAKMAAAEEAANRALAEQLAAQQPPEETWVGTKRTGLSGLLVKGLGHTGGALASVGNAAVGAATVVGAGAGTILSPITGAIGYALSGPASGGTRAKTAAEKASEEKARQLMIAEQHLRGEIDDKTYERLVANIAPSTYRGGQKESGITAAISGAASANLTAMKEGFIDVAALPSALAEAATGGYASDASEYVSNALGYQGDPGIFGYQDKTAVTRGNERRSREVYEGMGYGAGLLTEIGQTTAYVSGQAAAAVAGVEGQILTGAGRIASRLPGASTASNIAGRVGSATSRTVGAAYDFVQPALSTTARAASEYMPTFGKAAKGVGRGLSDFAEGVGTVGQLTLDTAGRGLGIAARPFIDTATGVGYIAKYGAKQTARIADNLPGLDKYRTIAERSKRARKLKATRASTYNERINSRRFLDMINERPDLATRNRMGTIDDVIARNEARLRIKEIEKGIKEIDSNLSLSFEDRIRLYREQGIDIPEAVVNRYKQRQASRAIRLSEESLGKKFSGAENRFVAERDFGVDFSRYDRLSRRGAARREKGTSSTVGRSPASKKVRDFAEAADSNMLAKRSLRDVTPEESVFWDKVDQASVAKQETRNIIIQRNQEFQDLWDTFDPPINRKRRISAEEFVKLQKERLSATRNQADTAPEPTGLSLKDVTAQRGTFIEGLSEPNKAKLAADIASDRSSKAAYDVIRRSEIESMTPEMKARYNSVRSARMNKSVASAAPAPATKPIVSAPVEPPVSTSSPNAKPIAVRPQVTTSPAPTVQPPVRPQVTTSPAPTVQPPVRPQVAVSKPKAQAPEVQPLKSDDTTFFRTSPREQIEDIDKEISELLREQNESRKLFNRLRGRRKVDHSKRIEELKDKKRTLRAEIDRKAIMIEGAKKLDIETQGPGATFYEGDEWKRLLEGGIPNKYRTYGVSVSSYSEAEQAFGRLRQAHLEARLGRKISDTPEFYLGAGDDTVKVDQYGNMIEGKKLTNLIQQTNEKYGAISLGISDSPTAYNIDEYGNISIYGKDVVGRSEAILYNIPGDEVTKELLENIQKLGIQKFNKGGIVYANNGALITAQNQGTDTVPAMLTPGEFVVNRQAAQQHMPILNAINQGYYNHGGIVQHLANGGIVAPQYYAGGGVASGIMGIAANMYKGKDATIAGLDMEAIRQLASSLSALTSTFGSLDNLKSFGSDLKQTMGSMGQNVATFGEYVSQISQSQVNHVLNATFMHHNSTNNTETKAPADKGTMVSQQHMAIVDNLYKIHEGAIGNGSKSSIIGHQG